MNKIISISGKVVAGILLAGLLAVNIQIGNEGNFFGVAKASNVLPVPRPNPNPLHCPPAANVCGVIFMPGTIPFLNIGKPITVTPN